MKIGPIVFHRAKNNLGCTALKIGNWFYVDTFKTPKRGLYFNICNRSGWIYTTKPRLVIRGKRRSERNRKNG